jgi:hypothetical protein
VDNDGRLTSSSLSVDGREGSTVFAQRARWTRDGSEIGGHLDCAPAATGTQRRQQTNESGTMASMANTAMLRYKVEPVIRERLSVEFGSCFSSRISD